MQRLLAIFLGLPSCNGRLVGGFGSCGLRRLFSFLLKAELLQMSNVGLLLTFELGFMFYLGLINQGKLSLHAGFSGSFPCNICGGCFLSELCSRECISFLLLSGSDLQLDFSNSLLKLPLMGLSFLDFCISGVEFGLCFRSRYLGGGFLVCTRGQFLSLLCFQESLALSCFCCLLCSQLGC